MKDTIKEISKKYGTNKIRYGLIVFGSKATITIPFRTTSISPEDVSSYLDTVRKNDRQGNLDLALEEAKKMFLGARPTAKKILVVITDKASDSYGEDIEVCFVRSINK